VKKVTKVAMAKAAKMPPVMTTDSGREELNMRLLVS
jgi:hypothetical protein